MEKDYIMKKEYVTKKGNNVTFTIRKTTTEEKLKTLVGLTGVGLLIWWLFFE
ncbi:hypothetical protein KG091_05835 [Carnobacteriaceae bacterium zg-ZUI78]|nr:hypothetical protein [Carnobacteriaceae bacterium zg-ZUI78]